MSRHLIVFGGLLSLLIFLSCTGDGEISSKDVMSEEKMKSILLDFHVAEAIAGKKEGVHERKEVLREELHQEILEQYGETKETFYQSYQYYLQHPAALDSIYTSIIQILEEKSEKKEPKKFEPPKEDSIPFMKKRPSFKQAESEE